jgi:hypothetical protein
MVRTKPVARQNPKVKDVTVRIRHEAGVARLLLSHDCAWSSMMEELQTQLQVRKSMQRRMRMNSKIVQAPGMESCYLSKDAIGRKRIRAAESSSIGALCTVPVKFV